MSDKSFDKIRPLYDHEIKPALKRITEQPQFKSIVDYLYPDRSVEELAATIRSYDNIHDLQTITMADIFRRIIDKTTAGITAEGLEKLEKGKPYLFVSNHRDIVLDPAIHFYIMVENGFDTGQIAFGDNLMLSPLFVDIAKVNKVLTVFRNGTMKEKLQNSKTLSAYLRYLVTERKESVWIAQRNGRTKDGNDRTDPGLLKMFQLSYSGDIIENGLAELNIVPVSISYEYEPCDELKALEIYLTRLGTFQKKPGDDYTSILTGLKQYKGRMHLAYGDPIEHEFLEGKRGDHRNDFFNNVALAIDHHMVCNFKLWPNNYIAHDLLNESEEFLGEHYTLEERDDFVAYMKEKTAKSEDPKEIEALMLAIYANPVKNKRKC